MPMNSCLLDKRLCKSRICFPDLVLLWWVLEAVSTDDFGCLCTLGSSNSPDYIEKDVTRVRSVACPERQVHHNFAPEKSLARHPIIAVPGIAKKVSIFCRSGNRFKLVGGFHPYRSRLHVAF